jgi:hypothetical protein
MQHVSKVSFFYSADLRTRCARAANFPSREKSIRYFTHLFHFDKCHSLSKRNVKLKIKLNKKTLYSTRLCVNWTFFGMGGPNFDHLLPSFFYSTGEPFVLSRK